MKVTFESHLCKAPVQIRVKKDKYLFRHSAETFTGVTSDDMILHFKDFVESEPGMFWDKEQKRPYDSLVVVVETVEILCHCDDDAFGDKIQTRLTVSPADLTFDCGCWDFQNLVRYIYKQFKC